MTVLKNKTALVTGGSRGLGKATALALAKEGVAVAITGRNEATLKATVKEIEALEVRATYAVFDVGNYEAVKQGIKTIMDAMGQIDILVNNAGIAGVGSFLDMPVADWEQMIQTNLMGMYYVTKEVLPQMVARNEGDIVNISSTAGLNGNPNVSAYSASKFAVIGMSESLMKEVRKHNVRVITMTPSTIESDMTIDLGFAQKGSEENILQLKILQNLLCLA